MASMESFVAVCGRCVETFSKNRKYALYLSSICADEAVGEVARRFWLSLFQPPQTTAFDCPMHTHSYCRETVQHTLVTINGACGVFVILRRARLVTGIWQAESTHVVAATNAAEADVGRQYGGKSMKEFMRCPLSLCFHTPFIWPPVSHVCPDLL